MRRFGGWAVIVLAWAGESWAEVDPKAAEILAAIDKSLASATDQALRYDIITQEAGKADRLISIDVTVKGRHWRRVEFVAPADVKGTRILVISPTQSYVYLPAFRKVRRIASHVKEQGFLGSAYDQDEVSLASYSEIFAAVGLRDLGDAWEVDIIRRPEAEFAYGRLVIVADKRSLQPVELRYFDDAGIKLKTEKRYDFDCEHGACAPRLMEMVDHSRGDIKSQMIRRRWKVNQGVPDDFFTVRALQQGG